MRILKFLSLCFGNNYNYAIMLVMTKTKDDFRKTHPISITVY